MCDLNSIHKQKNKQSKVKEVGIDDDYMKEMNEKNEEWGREIVLMRV